MLHDREKMWYIRSKFPRFVHEKRETKAMISYLFYFSLFTVDESCNVTQTQKVILESIWSTIQSFVMVAIKLAQVKC